MPGEDDEKRAQAEIMRRPEVRKMLDAFGPPTERCSHTGNPCGTDTWMVGYTCPCPSCQRRLAAQPPAKL